MRVLITGVTGYIGANLARTLINRGESVFGLVRSPLNQTYIGDIAERFTPLYWDGDYGSMRDALTRAAPDDVYHLATYYTGSRGKEHIERLVNSNLTLGAYLLEAMAETGCTRIVYANTVMAHFGGTQSYRPQNLYAATKQAFSDLLEYYTSVGLMRAATVMLSDTYGPGDQRPKILNLIMHAAQNEQRLALSDGTQDYDLLYIDDAVDALIAAQKYIQENTGAINDIFQAPCAELLTLRQTVELMLEVNGMELNAGWGERPPVPAQAARAVRVYPTVPGWTPKVGLREGLRRILIRN